MTTPQQVGLLEDTLQKKIIKIAKEVKVTK